MPDIDHVVAAIQKEIDWRKKSIEELRDAEHDLEDKLNTVHTKLEELRTVVDSFEYFLKTYPGAHLIRETIKDA